MREDDISTVNARFPAVVNKEILCGTFVADKMDPTKLSKLLPGVQLKENPLLHQNIQIKEPRNWMGVSISDLGRGYAWSDYIQLVGMKRKVHSSVFIIPMEEDSFRSRTR